MSARPIPARTPAARLSAAVGPEVGWLLLFLLVVLLAFGLVAPRFLSGANLGSIAFQLPELGLLTLAMLIPIVSGGLNLAIIATANVAGLTLAGVLAAAGGVDAGPLAFALGVVLALGAGALSGLMMGLVIAFTGAHPILVSLSMMIFLRGLGEFLTRGGDISGFPAFVAPLGHGSLLGVPVPLLLFGGAAIAWALLLGRTRHGFAARMIGSNPEAARFAGIPVRRTLVLIYTLSGVMCAVAGILMLARFNSVRVGHGEALLLVTVLACFLGGVDPFGGFGRVLPVVIALVILQVLSSGLNLMGANQHLATAIWGLFLLAVMAIRFLAAKLRPQPRRTD